MLFKRGSALATALAAISLAVSAPSASAATCTPGWTVAKTLPAGSSVNKVSVLAGSAWAVGGRSRTDGSGITDPLIMRFDGTRWAEVPAPSADVLRGDGWTHFSGVHLHGVFARTATDVWAVGTAGGSSESNEGHDMSFAVTMHWDGTAWRYVPAGGGEVLRDVIAFGPDDAWAVGSEYWDVMDSGRFALVMHWDGQRWTKQDGPWGGTIDPDSGPVGHGHMFAAARTPYGHRFWAVGNPQYGDASVRRGFIARYRDDGWTQAFTEPGVSLRDVAALAWNDAWAVGQRADGSTVALHRDGARWSVVPTPGTGVLSAVSGASSSDVWAIGSGTSGYDHAGNPADSGPPLMQHWDGTSWAAVTPPAGITKLYDVAMRPSGWGWAVGYTATRSVILRHCPA